MSLERTFEIKEQELAVAKKTELQAAKKKEISSTRQEITALGNKRDEIGKNVDELQELKDLQENEKRDFKETNKIIEELLKKHKNVLAKEGIEDKKGIISKYPEEEEVVARGQAHQKFKETASKILGKREELKKQGLENVRGKKLETEKEEKMSEFSEKIDELKLKTPEGKREKREEFKENIREIINKRTDWRRGIDETTFPYNSCLEEAKKYGKGGKKIAKQEIEKAAFQSAEKQMRNNLSESDLNDLVTENVLESIKDHIKLKVDYEWLETEKYAADDHGYSQIKYEKREIDDKKITANKALDGLDEIQSELDENELNEKVNTEEKKFKRGGWGAEEKTGNVFYSPEKRKLMNDLDEKRKVNKDALEKIEKQIEDKEEEGQGFLGIKGKKNKAIIDDLKDQAGKIKEENEALWKERVILRNKEQEQFEKLNKIIEELALEEIDLGKISSSKKEKTLKESLSSIREVLEGVKKKDLSPEKMEIFQEYKKLEEKTEEAKEKYEEIKEQRGTYLDYIEG